MKKSIFLLGWVVFGLTTVVQAQPTFPYRVDIQPLTVQSLPGLHSFAFGQHDGKWLLIGGRTDGLHPRQPFASFPASNNNTMIYVVDAANGKSWSANLSALGTNLQEQMQSSNMSFHQSGDTLYVLGGYGYSPTQDDHITFPFLTSIQVSDLMEAVQQTSNIAPYFKQLQDTLFAVAGGHLGQLDDQFLIVGGHRFDGRYNPMGHNTYIQQYTEQIRRFNIHNHGNQLSISNLKVQTDQAHLHRRDYNLMPYINTQKDEGYWISSGVFQIQQDLPFLYPVEVDATSYTPVNSFNQYLSHYHSAIMSAYDSSRADMHMLFFGGLGQYYYSGSTRIQDDQVPFVKTISRVSRDATGKFTEFKLSDSMPGYLGTSAEFIPNLGLKHYDNEVFKMNKWNADTVLIGHIVGGIQSQTLNPFADNNTGQTAASPTVYKVQLIYDASLNIVPLQKGPQWTWTVYPNPSRDEVRFDLNGGSISRLSYMLLDAKGRVVKQGWWPSVSSNMYRIPGLKDLARGQYNLVITINEGQILHENIMLE